MPDPAALPANLTDEQIVAQKLQDIITQHPGFADPTRQGGLTRDYNPVALPDDPTAQRYYQQAIPDDGSSGGQPAPDSAPPAPVQAQQPAGPAAASTTDTSGGLIFGKYKSLDEANRGYWELVDKQKATNAENTALKAVNLHLEQVLGPLRQPREAPTQPAYIPVTLQGEQPVVQAQPFIDQTRAIAAEEARQQVAAALQPLQKLNEAQVRLSSEFPDL